MKKALSLSLLLFLIISYCNTINAQTFDSTHVIKTLDSLRSSIKSINETLTNVKTRTDTLAAHRKQDSLTINANDSTLSNALAYAKLHPQTLYKPLKEHGWMSFFAFTFLAAF